MKTLNTWICILAMLLLSSIAIAQPRQGNNSQARQDRVAKVEAARVSFISQRLNLTPQQAEKFWPIYNQYTAEAREIRRQYRSARKSGGAQAAPGRVDLDEELDLQQAYIDLRRRYNDRFLQVISPAQVTALYDAERDFRQALQQRMQGRRK